MPANPDAIGEYLKASSDRCERTGEETINRILGAVRRHLGMEIAFTSRFIDGRREFTHVDSSIPLPMGPGDSEPLEETFCQRVLDGRLPALIHDARDYPAALELPLTHALPVGAHLNVPLRLHDGTLYGTFCCVSRQPDHSLSPRDVATVRAFAQLAAEEIEQQLDYDERRVATAARINEMLNRGRVDMAFQTIHRLETGAPVGVECLARFADHDARPPSDWFAEAASIGLGRELEMLAAREAVAALPRIPSGFYAAINVSPATVMSGELRPLLVRLPVGRVVIEITEHSQVEDYRALRAAIDALRGHARIAIDDVGAGYASLRHILDLRPDIIKLDMSMTRHIDRDPARSVLAQAMVTFARGISASIVAEGVETEAEARTLRGLGVAYGQGYHFGRPQSVAAVREALLHSAAADPLPVQDCVPTGIRAARR